MPVPTVDHPFTPQSLEELPLSASPLVTVLWQARFPGSVTKIANALRSGRLQALLSDTYPYAQEMPPAGVAVMFQINQTPVAQPASSTWALTDDARTWQVGLGPESVSLQAQAYGNRADFMERVAAVLSAVDECCRPPTVARVGVRYFNRVTGPLVNEMPDLLSNAARGLFSVLSVEDRGDLVHGYSDFLYRYPPDRREGIQARLGLLPPNVMFDAVAPAVSDKSWIIDLDAFSDSGQPFDRERILADSVRMAERCYQFFRWALPLSALRRFGATA